MSVINQMLRELDARRAPAAVVERVPPSPAVAAVRTGPGKRRVGAGLALIGAAFLAGAALWGGNAPRPATLVHSPATERGTGAAQVPRAMTPQPAAPIAVPASPAHSARPRTLSMDQNFGGRAGVPETTSAAPPGQDGAAAPPRIAPLAATFRANPGVALARPSEAKEDRREENARDEPPLPGPDRQAAATVRKTASVGPEAEARALLDQARQARDSGDDAAARALTGRALARAPDFLAARLALAASMHEAGETDAALAVLEAGYARRPQPALAVAAGRMQADRGRESEALVWLARGGTELRPADHAMMGALSLRARRHAEAIGAYRRALAGDPRQGGWLLGLGLAYEEAGRAEEARNAYRAALEQGGFKPEVVEFLQQKVQAPDR